MPLTKFQAKIALLLSSNKTIDNHLAGGAALHLEANSIRYSQDLDYFNDSVERVATAYKDDYDLLITNGYTCKNEVQLVGYIRALVSKGSNHTKIEWAHDSSWRFMPPEYIKEIGYRLHPIDLAINKVLALAGRDEPRDYLDVLIIHKTILPLGPLCWAACGKDPGFNPLSLLELLKRRGKYRPEDFTRLQLSKTVDIVDLKTNWLEALGEAENFITSANPTEIGCLYYSKKEKKFITPDVTKLSKDTVVHYGKLGGSIPSIK
ncbi:MAG: hypothetical protein ISR65_07995 [Bacteriovoracaceae bacterium]|nr:hypothetical protein [Bacteriovoracaceae bacterium]